MNKPIQKELQLVIDKPMLNPQIIHQVFTHEENHDPNSMLGLDGLRSGDHSPRSGKN
jgi:hypothetical protein